MLGLERDAYRDCCAVKIVDDCVLLITVEAHSVVCVREAQVRAECQPLGQLDTDTRLKVEVGPIGDSGSLIVHDSRSEITEQKPRCWLK